MRGKVGEKIEFQDGEVPDKNPNPKNDLYTKDGHSLKDDIIIGVLCFAYAAGSIFFAIFAGRAAMFPRIILIMAGIIIILCFAANMCEKYYCRKRVFAFGTPCAGLIIESSAYQARQSKYGRRIRYKIKIKYDGSETALFKYKYNPREYLENPYCTVYKWKKRIIAADFKVREKD